MELVPFVLPLEQSTRVKGLYTFAITHENMKCRDRGYLCTLVRMQTCGTGSWAHRCQGLEHFVERGQQQSQFYRHLLPLRRRALGQNT